MNILLIQDYEDARERIAFSLEGHFKSNVFEAKTADEGLALLKAGQPGMDLIIWDYSKDSATALGSSELGKIETPVIVCTPGGVKVETPSVLKSVVAFADREQAISDLIMRVTRLLKDETVISAPDQREFCKIRTRLLLSVCPLKSDVFIRLNESKYVKLFHAGDVFELQDMEKYTFRKGLEFLYIRQSAVREFIEKYRADLEKLLEPNYFLKLDELNKVSEPIFETVQEMGKQFGFNKDVQSLARTQVRMTMKTMGKKPGLRDVLKRLEKFQAQYITSHSILTGFIGCAIASYMNWGSESTFEKLTLAAFLHDIALDNQELAACENVQEVMNKKLDDGLDEFKEHPDKAADIARSFTDVPPDVDVIVAQHHERPDGTGFPKKLAGRFISPLAAVFIVAHDLAKYRMAANEKFNMNVFLEQARETYTMGQFKKALIALEDVQLD